MSNKTYKDWSCIDITGVLSMLGIDYSESGKNIGTGYIGVETCPFCDAPGNHFGIRIESNIGTCFVCGESCTPPKFVKEVTQESWPKVYEILNEFSDGDRYIPPAPKPGEEIIFPKGVGELHRAAYGYLCDRKFPPWELIKKYRIQSTRSSFLEIEDSKWDFSNRVIIPIYMEKRLVSYTGRSFVEHDVRYMNSPTEACIVPCASCLYNIDTVKDKVIFVEGITDVWRMGNESVGTMGVKVTKDQISYIGSKNIKEAYIMFDAGAGEQAGSFGAALSSFINKVKIITLETSDDPGDLSVQDAMRIKYELIGRV